jgi:hypothetical protein
MNTATTTRPGTRPTACGCEPHEPFCTCPSAAAALFDDRYDHHIAFDHIAFEQIPFDPFHTINGHARIGVRA